MAIKTSLRVAASAAALAIAGMVTLPTAARADDAAAQLYKTKCA